jgi:hypothetical protein
MLPKEAYEDVVAQTDAAHLPTLLDALSEREREVIRSRFGLGCPPLTSPRSDAASGSRVSGPARSRPAPLRKLPEAAGWEVLWGAGPPWQGAGRAQPHRRPAGPGRCAIDRP